MPTKRTPLRRSHHPPVSGEALACWRRLCELERRRGGTRSAEYAALGRKLCTLVGIEWVGMVWPTDARSATVPASYRHRPLQAEDYRRAYAARQALIAAAAANGHAKAG